MNYKGFSLIEIVIVVAVLAILGGGITPLAFTFSKIKRERVTKEKMQTIYEAIMGNPRMGRFGYLGDTGDLPASLGDLLVKPAGVSSFTTYTNNVVYGWRGPYLDEHFGELKDGWGNNFRFSIADGLPEGQIKSAGDDGVFETADDLIFPNLEVGQKVEKTAPLLLTIMVNNIPNPQGIDVKVYYAVNGGEAPVQLVGSSSGPAFDGKGFRFETHQGIHAVYFKHRGTKGAITDNLFNVNIVAGIQNHVIVNHHTSAAVEP